MSNANQSYQIYEFLHTEPRTMATGMS